MVVDLVMSALHDLVISPVANKVYKAAGGGKGNNSKNNKKKR